jgi:hypothetical protein
MCNFSLLVSQFLSNLDLVSHFVSIHIYCVCFHMQEGRYKNSMSVIINTHFWWCVLEHKRLVGLSYNYNRLVRFWIR